MTWVQLQELLRIGIYNFQFEQIENRKMTINRFLQKYTSGTYLILVRGHVAIVKNGKLIDHTLKLRRIVKQAYKVTEIK